jgi:hypothetical protein
MIDSDKNLDLKFCKTRENAPFLRICIWLSKNAKLYADLEFVDTSFKKC